MPLSHWTQLTQRRLLKSKAPVNVVKSTFIYSLAQKTQNFRFFFYKKIICFFYVFISFLKQFQKYSLRSYFQDLGFAFSLLFLFFVFALCCFYSKVHLTIGTHGYKLKKRELLAFQLHTSVF